jgi:hypothetical protein
MSASSTLVVHCGGVRRTRDELATLPTPAATPTWRPVPHADLVAALVEGLAARDVRVVREEYCTMGAGDVRLLGALDLQVAGFDSPDLMMGLGLRAGNDRATAVRFVAAARVFICDNWAFAGSEGAVFLRKKHTSGLDVRAVVPGAVEQFLGRAEGFRLDIERMRGAAITDARAKAIVHDAFATGALPVRLFRAVSDLYFRDERQAERFPERTLWSLNNAMTEAVKVLPAAPQQAYGLAIGRLFGGLLHREAAALPAPAAVFDED